MLRLITIGDLHFDKLKKLFPNNHVEIVCSEFRRVCNYAVEKGVKYIVQLGDVCDTSRMSYESHVGLIQVLHEFTNTLEFHFILGNHDFDEHGVNSLQILETIKKTGGLQHVSIHTKPTQKVVEGVTLNFLPYPHKVVITSDNQSVNFAHFEVSGSTRDNGRTIENDVKIEDNNVWILGHLHTPHDLSSRIKYSGTLIQYNFGENEEKGFIDCKFKYEDGVLKHKMDRVSQKSGVRLINLEISSLSDFDKIESDPFIKYKLWLQNEILVDFDITSKFPNVVKIQGFTSREDLQASIDQEIVNTEYTGEISFDVKTELSTWLSTKLEDKTQLDRAISLMDTL